MRKKNRVSVHVMYVTTDQFYSKTSFGCLENRLGLSVITNMITERVGRHNVILPINHNHYNFPKKYKTHLKNSF